MEISEECELRGGTASNMHAATYARAYEAASAYEVHAQLRARAQLNACATKNMMDSTHSYAMVSVF